VDNNCAVGSSQVLDLQEIHISFPR
jgi:hypothetical protein